jgi:predicted MFS family arabinose efflux permease
MYMSFTYVAALLHERTMLDAARIGLLIALFGAGGFAFVLMARPIVKRTRESPRALLGGALSCLGFLLLMGAGSALVAGGALFILGLGFFMLHKILQARAAAMAPDAAGAAMSLFAATFFLAQAVGAMIGGWSFDHLGASTCCSISAALFAALGAVTGYVTRQPGVPRATDRSP